MAQNLIHASRQIKGATVTKSLLVSDFLEGGNLNLTGGANNATITGLAAGSSANDAVNKAQLDSALAAITGKMIDSVDAISSTNQALTGVGQTINGRTIISGDRVFLYGQTTTTEDGVYVAAVGAWSRSADAQVGMDIGGKAVIYENAANNLPQLWAVINPAGSGVIGTDNISLVKGYDVTVVTTYVDNEAPSVTNNNAVITIATAPNPTTSLSIFLNGVRYSHGNGGTLSGTTFTFDSVLLTGDYVVASYRY